MPWLRRLVGQLALSYALTTIAALLIVEVAAVTVLFVVVNSFLPRFVALGLQQESDQVSTAFAHGTPDPVAVDAWLDIPNPLAGGEYDPGYLTVVDGGGRVVGSVGNARLPAGLDLSRSLLATTADQLRRVLAGRTGPDGLAGWQPGGGL